MKTKSRRSQAQPPTDYDTDAPCPSPRPAPAPLAPRTAAELNLSVLRRYSSSIAAIVAIAPYAVLYLFAHAAQKWDKCNVEGSLFVCRLLPEPGRPPGAARFAAVILNRRGLDNFATYLDASQDVDVTDDFIILQVHDDRGSSSSAAAAATTTPTTKVYGLWIFSEAGTSTAVTRAQIADTIAACAAEAETSLAAAEEELAAAEEELARRQGGTRSAQGQQQQQQHHHQHHTPAEVEEEEEAASASASVPMGRQLSLRQLFGQQREQDAGFSVHEHRSPRPPPPSRGMFMANPDTDFFRGASPYKAAMASRAETAREAAAAERANAAGGGGKGADSTAATAATAASAAAAPAAAAAGAGGTDLLGELFRKASLGR